MLDQQTETKVASRVPPPCEMPNGLQWFEGELYVMDQATDDVCVIDESGTEIRRISTPTENGSGISIGGGFLWTASNGNTTSREYRTTDTHQGCILQLDLRTGEEVGRIPTPDGKGIHGIEWDDGLLWLTAFNPKALVLVDPTDFTVVRRWASDLVVLHGLARDGEGIWCSDRMAKAVVKYEVETGQELDRTVLPVFAQVFANTFV